MIKVVTFDLDGVYFPDGKENFIKSIVSMGVREDEVKRVFLKSPQMNLEYKNGLMGDMEFWSWAVKEWRLKIPWQEVVDRLIDSYAVDSEVSSIVRKLRQKGCKTAICSNNFPARIEGLRKRFGFLDDFDVVVLSYEVGASKPKRRIFEELVSQSGVEARSIIFADDNPDNLAGSKAVGITTLVYSGFSNYIQQLRNLGLKI